MERNLAKLYDFMITVNLQEYFCQQV